jgi:hypothetical protein
MTPVASTSPVGDTTASLHPCVNPGSIPITVVAGSGGASSRRRRFDEKTRAASYQQEPQSSHDPPTDPSPPGTPPTRLDRPVGKGGTRLAVQGGLQQTAHPVLHRRPHQPLRRAPQLLQSRHRPQRLAQRAPRVPLQLDAQETQLLPTVDGQNLPRTTTPAVSGLSNQQGRSGGESSSPHFVTSCPIPGGA